MTQRARPSLISGQVDQNFLNQRENCRVCNNYKVRIHLQMVWGCFRLGFGGQRLAGNIDPVVAEILPRLIVSEQSFWCICCKFSAVSGGRLDQSGPKAPFLHQLLSLLSQAAAVTAWKKESYNMTVLAITNLSFIIHITFTLSPLGLLDLGSGVLGEKSQVTVFAVRADSSEKGEMVERHRNNFQIVRCIKQIVLLQFELKKKKTSVSAYWHSSVTQLTYHSPPHSPSFLDSLMDRWRSDLDFGKDTYNMLLI